MKYEVSYKEDPESNVISGCDNLSRKEAEELIEEKGDKIFRIRRYKEWDLDEWNGGDALQTAMNRCWSDDLTIRRGVLESWIQHIYWHTGVDGALIGNSFKALFTRLDRPFVIEKIYNILGEPNPFDEESTLESKIKIIFREIESESDYRKQNKLKEVACGYFQYNILRHINSSEV